MIILTIVILPNLNLKELEKEEQTKPTASKRKEIIKIRAEINENKTQKKRGGEERSKKQSWFFEKLNRINKPLARYFKKKRERVHSSKIRIENEEAKTNITEE